MKEFEVVEPAKPIRFINGALGVLTRALLTIAGVMVILMALVTAYSVIRRYLFHSPDNNAYLGISVFMLICVVFSFAEIQRLKQNITVDYFSNRLSHGMREILENVITPILGLFFCIALAWKNWNGALFALKIGERTITNIALPTFPLKAAITLGIGLVCLVLITQLLSYFASLGNRRASRNQPPPKN